MPAPCNSPPPPPSPSPSTKQPTHAGTTPTSDGTRAVKRHLSHRVVASLDERGPGVTRWGCSLRLILTREVYAAVDAGEESAFRDFVVGRSAPLFRTALLLTADRSLAEDVVQATLTKMFLAWPRIQRADLVEAYARKVLLREVLSWRRRKRLAEVSLDADLHAVGVDATDRIAVRATLQEALRQLSPRQRAVVVLRYFDDVPDDGIADMLGITTGAVKSHAARALAHLRIVLGADSAAVPEEL
jgi:RNA polymerase sigma-70 factor (sigma-E family)